MHVVYVVCFKVRGGAANDSRLAESLIAHSKAQERSEAEVDFLRAEVRGEARFVRCSCYVRSKIVFMFALCEPAPLMVSYFLSSFPLLRNMFMLK